jgi:tetratricopeptide (TPR) repeat protein
MRVPEENKPQPARQRSPFLLGFLSSVIMIIVALLLLEIGLRIIGYGDPNERRDPFFGFDGTPPVYNVSGESGQEQHYVPRPNMSDISRTFPVDKPSGSYRVFAFGGSTTHGTPYGNEGGFPHFLEQELRAFYPDRSVEVINVGVRGFGSSRVLQIVEEMVEYEPDLFVVYMGQNESRDAKFHYWELHRSPLTSSLLGVLLQSRALYLLHEGYIELENRVFDRRVTSYGASLIESILVEQDAQKGFESFDYYAVPVVKAIHPVAEKADKDEKPELKENLKTFVKQIFRRGYMHMSGEEVEENFRKNVTRIIGVAKEHDIDIVFLELTSNPKSRSLISLDTLGLPQEFLETFPMEEWSTLYSSGIEGLKNADYEQAAAALEAARALLADHEDRTLQVYLGEAYEGEGRYALAYAAYEQRLSPEKARLNVIIRTAGEANGVPVLDVTALFHEHAENGIVGYENYFVDSIHMLFDGYRLIGHALAGELIRNGTLPATSIDLHDVARQMEAIQAEQTVLVASTLGWAAFNQGRIEQALQLGEQALVLDPEDIGAHVLLGYVYTRLGNHEAARATRDQLERLYANVPD